MERVTMIKGCIHAPRQSARRSSAGGGKGVSAIPFGRGQLYSPVRRRIGAGIQRITAQANRIHERRLAGWDASERMK